jgi:diaminopimelate decarboxylase
MKVTASEHMRLESDARSFLNKLKHCKKIIDFTIDKISTGEIKVTLKVGSKEDAIIQLRSRYSRKVIEDAIKARVPASASERLQKEEVELVEA